MDEQKVEAQTLEVNIEEKKSPEIPEEAEIKANPGEKFPHEKAREGDSPVRPVRQVVKDSGDPGYVNRLLVATPTTGGIRMEWAVARYGQTIPMNWSQVQMVQFLNPYVPLRYTVADAQNLIVKQLVEKDFEWLLLIEQDVVLPADAFMKFNKYMRDEKVPIVSGLYFTKSKPSEPLIFRGRGNSFFQDWKMGDKVWVDGVPTGVLLIHGSILREMWKESAEYKVANGEVTRRVFDTPRKMWLDPQSDQFNTISGTSDLEWCTRIMEGKYFEKAGWTEYQSKKYPFLMDTTIFCRHIDESGIQYPTEVEYARF